MTLERRPLRPCRLPTSRPADTKCVSVCGSTKLRVPERVVSPGQCRVAPPLHQPLTRSRLCKLPSVWAPPRKGLLCPPTGPPRAEETRALRRRPPGRPPGGSRGWPRRPVPDCACAAAAREVGGAGRRQSGRGRTDGKWAGPDGAAGRRAGGRRAAERRRVRPAGIVGRGARGRVLTAGVRRRGQKSRLGGRQGLGAARGWGLQIGAPGRAWGLRARGCGGELRAEPGRAVRGRGATRLLARGPALPSAPWPKPLRQQAPRTSAGPQLRPGGRRSRPGPECIPVFPFPASPRAACSGVSQTRVGWNLRRRPRAAAVRLQAGPSASLCSRGVAAGRGRGLRTRPNSTRPSRQCWAPPRSLAPSGDTC